MKQINWVFFCLLFVQCHTKAQHPTASTEPDETFRKALSRTDSISVYEGLPHPKFESDLYKKESVRKDIVQIAGYSFYMPSTVSLRSDQIKKLLEDPTTIQPFSGEKLCGGFHPDYCIAWKEGAKTFYALICFGCQEIILSQEDKSVRYDLEVNAMELLKMTLSPHKLKRP